MVAVAAGLSTACTGVFTGGDDTPTDAPTDPDALRAGLTIEWKSKPGSVPGNGPNGTRIERAVFNLAMLRIVSDAGPRQLAPVSVEWADMVVPASVAVDDAPAGRYSRCLFDLAPMGESSYAYLIEGEVDISGEDREFVIRDTVPLAIALDYSVDLPPGGTAKIPIEFDLAKLVGIVDWSMLVYSNGRYTIDASTTELSKVRNLVDDAIDFDD